MRKFPIMPLNLKRTKMTCSKRGKQGLKGYKFGRCTISAESKVTRSLESKKLFFCLLFWQRNLTLFQRC